ncbi:MAG: hypothetical protein M1822_005958 [Bathelium mastoideum]|nr:MAG: hypothetical protein M1822_005958 [Bathelium mastoideum]
MDGYEKQRAHYEDTKLAEIEGLFRVAMREYRTIIGVGEDAPADRFTKCDSWEELAALVQGAEEAYLHQAGRARRLSRTIGDYAFALKAWVNLLPTDQNMSIMGGGVKLLLEAAGRRSAQRERMLIALRRFLEVVAESEQSLRQFCGDRGLRESAISLYVAILKMIEASINSLINESIWKKVKYGFLGERPAPIQKFSAEDVDQICSHCDKMQHAFDRQIQAMTRTKIVETADATQRMEAQVVETVAPSVQRTENKTAETYDTAKDIQERSRRIDFHILRVSDSVETQGDILLNIREMLRDLLSNNEWQREAEERRSQTTRLQVENYQLGLEHMRSFTPNEGLSEGTKKWFLWKILDVDPERCIEEAGSMLRTGQGQGLNRVPGQVLKMYKHSRVRGFLTSATSDAILVEALLDGQEITRCSPMSLASAMLLQDVSGYAHAAAIHYFCGAHNSMQDPVSGGIGIARVLVGQLLCLQEFDFAFLNEEWSAALNQGDPHALLQLFEPLIAQLQVSTLFCVIDGINLFEGNTRKDETIALISTLLRVARECRHLVHLKLLVTSAAKSRYVAPMFQQDSLKGVVRLQLDDEEMDVSMKAVRLEIARSGGGPSRESP